MKIWWEVGYTWQDQPIKPIRVVSHTDKTIVKAGVGGGRVHKRSDGHNYFSSLEEAVAFTKERATKAIENAKERAEREIASASMQLQSVAALSEADMLAAAQKEWAMEEAAKGRKPKV